MTPDHPRGDGAEPDWLGDFFAGPTDEDRARLRADLLSRSAQVRANGWEPYRGLWSTGEAIGVAVVLGEDSELAALGESVQSAWERWAFDLWGLDGGQTDVDKGCEATREWFLDAANELGVSAQLGPRTFGQFPDMDIAEEFDDPLPVEEMPEGAQSGLDVGGEAHRQSALAADSTSAAEDQAWVDDISEFGEQTDASELDEDEHGERQAGDQE